MESLDRLISRLNRLPGIGIKTAQRLAYHIISLPDEDAAALANSIEDAHRLVHFCPICGNYNPLKSNIVENMIQQYFL